MKKRNVFLSLIFCILTLGIYYIYWYVSLTNASNKLAPKHATMGGIAAWIVSVLTLGIYSLYWSYRMGQKAGEMLNAQSDGFLYLFLFIFTLGIVPICLGQSALNKAIAAEEEKELERIKTEFAAGKD